MMFQGLAPGMQDHSDPEFAPKPLGITPERPQGGRGSLEEETIEEARIALRQRVQRMRERKHTMKVRDGKQLAEPRFDPAELGHGLALGTVPILARMIAEDLSVTVVTLRELTPQGRCTAGDDVLYHTALASGEAMGLLIDYAMGAQDVGDLHPLSCPVLGVRSGTHGSRVPKPWIVQQF